MASKKAKKKGHGIRVVDEDAPVTTAATAVTARTKKTTGVSPDGTSWNVRVKDGSRVASAGRGDRVAEELANCNDVDSLVAFASEFIPKEDVLAYLAKAPNFGQFRMVLGNRIRGAVNRAERERQKAESKKAVKA